MNGSIDTRQVPGLEDLVFARKSGEVPAQRGSEGAAVSNEKLERARVAVARNAADPQDCRTLLDMLGLLPSEEGGLPPVQR